MAAGVTGAGAASAAQPETKQISRKESEPAEKRETKSRDEDAVKVSISGEGSREAQNAQAAVQQAAVESEA